MNRLEIEKEEIIFESLNIEDFFILKDFIDNHFKTGIKGINDRSREPIKKNSCATLGIA
jgi:hypothetical protein